MFDFMLELVCSAFEYMQLMPLHLHVNQKSVYCKFGNFCENFLFVNSIKTY